MRRFVGLITLVWLMMGGALVALTVERALPLTNDVEILVLNNVSGTFEPVAFHNSYTQPPVVVCTPVLTSKSDVERVVRIDQRTSSGFHIKLQRPLDDPPNTPSKVECMVASEGVHTLENNYQFEAHSVESNDTSGVSADGWNGTGENVTSKLQLNYSTPPVVLGQVMSYNDANFSVFWSYDCQDKGTPATGSAMCVGKHIGQIRPTSSRQSETLGYIVVEEHNGAVNGTAYKAALGSARIIGTGNGGASYTVGSSLYTTGVATQNGMKGANGGWAVLYGNQPFAGSNLKLAIDEDTLMDQERKHTDEHVAYWIFQNDLNLTWMEVIKIPNVDGSWHNVSFRNTYTSAVPVCTYNLPANTDPDAVVRIQSVGNNGMQIKLQHPRSSSAVTAGDIHCIVMEEGNHTLNNQPVEAHRIVSRQFNTAWDWDIGKTEHPSYTNTYNRPVVLGQVMSYNDPQWTAFWCTKGDRKSPPDATNLYVGKHIGEDIKPHPRNNEQLGFIVGAPHEGEYNHIHYALGLGGDTVLGMGDSPPYPYSLTGYTHPHYRYGVATQSAQDGGHGSWAVLFGTDPIGTEIKLAVDEETVEGDTSRDHTTEQVSYWVFEPMPVMQITKSSCVLNDPVNASAHPKRIPGATIRYAIEVNNTGPGAADQVSVEDNLTAWLNKQTIRNRQVLDGPCDCTGATGTGTNGSVNGQTVTLDFGTISHGTATQPSVKCGYFEVEIR